MDAGSQVVHENRTGLFKTRCHEQLDKEEHAMRFIPNVSVSGFRMGSGLINRGLDERRNHPAGVKLTL
jgi:hypothetical protein